MKKTYRKDHKAEVLDFIKAFRNGSGDVRNVFGGEYSWHFAHMLCTTFGRGTVCLKYPQKHFVWEDTDGTAYNINGITEINDLVKEHIPERFLPAYVIDDFRRIPDVSGGSTKEEIDAVWENWQSYLGRVNIRY